MKPAPKTSADPKALSVDRVAELLSISAWSVRAAIRRGEIPHIKIGGRILVPADALDRMLNADITAAQA